MILNAVISIIVYTKSDKQRVDDITHKYEAITEFEDLSVGDREHFAYTIKLAYSPNVIQSCLRELNKIDHHIQDHPDNFGFEFNYEEEDYTSSPLFFIQSIGNKASLYIKSPNPKLDVFCRHCNRKLIEDDQKLVIDTNKLVKNPILYVDHSLVVSETLADKLRNSNLQGYDLLEVEHKGKKEAEIMGYQIRPTSVLPPQCIPDRYLDDPYINSQSNRCPVCKLGGHLFAPYYYNPEDLKEIKDFNYTFEYKDYNFVHRKTLISKRVVDFFKKENYINKIVNRFEPGGDKDWVLEPVLLNSDC